MKPSYFSKDIQEFLSLLAKHNVKYVIVGGEAVIPSFPHLREARKMKGGIALSERSAAFHEISTEAGFHGAKR